MTVLSRGPALNEQAESPVLVEPKKEKKESSTLCWIATVAESLNQEMEL